MSNKKYTSTSTADETLEGIEVETPWSKKMPSKGRFLKGPVSLSILQRASLLPGKALAMYLAIQHRCDVQRSLTTTLPTDYLASWGIGKDAKKRALDVLEGDGLVSVERQTGRTARASLCAGDEKTRQPQPENDDRTGQSHPDKT
jgi:hypothetical protein